ncbi:putative M protein [Neospora caninum Liverpool]|uniref:M protein, putative n=1 Tax=Neospora caninum (strain Liverpool) TaxID=572307 RepID=F0V713_NEOCL|nr:putative M protein [Neospora caninum Liverpool]CBZ49504.1 putative M protein [Neospora caninum Liverpool]CEL64083.1 TPA: M protein, putative [Neospora caninum Liverpool]|eukprot:XP_003879539.1 putative M protein [Neospora caninum Liverpool]
MKIGDGNDEETAFVALPEKAKNDTPLIASDHPLLERVQQTLFQQLSSQLKSAQLEYAEKRDQDKRLAHLHEELGLRLYNTQQELLKLQGNLEQLTRVEEEMKARRNQAEANLDKGVQDLEAKQKELDGYVTKLNNAQHELNELKFAVSQAQTYNEQLEADIKLKRREMYKENATLQRRETEKMQQDFLIDELKEKLRDLNDQKCLYENQAAVQTTKIEAARAALHEAQREIEAVAADKQRLLQQWRSSVVGMQRREEALQTVKQMAKKQEEKELAIEAEMRGVQATVREAQEQNENLIAQHNTNTSHMETLQSQIASVERDVEMVEKENNMIQKSVQYTLQEVSRAEVALSHFRNQVKRARKLNEQCKRKEEELEQVQNDTARKKVEALELKARHTGLQEDLTRVQKALVEKEKLVDQYEAEIKKGHIEIDKKQQLVEKLNKEYDERRSKFDDEGSGPLEAKIKGMRSRIPEVKHTNEGQHQERGCATFVKRRLSAAYVTVLSTLPAQISAKKDEQLISQQKRIRLTSEIALNSKEIKEMQGAIKDMRTEMSWVNQLIVKQAEKQQTYERETQSLAHDFGIRMAEHEKLEAQLAETTQNIREEKAKLEEELVEAERQIMLWERKIFLEKEMHEALDPAVGQSELVAMKKEIHRMKLRLDQLKKCQEQMLSEMQRVRLISVSSESSGELDEKTQALVQEITDASTIAAVKKVRNDAKSLTDTLNQFTKQERPELAALFDTFQEWAAAINAAAMPPLPASRFVGE